MRAKAVVIFLVFFLLASIWPGASLINRLEPSILGLPFNFAWYALLIIGAFLILLWLDAEQQRKEREEPGGAPNGAHPTTRTGS